MKKNIGLLCGLVFSMALVAVVADLDGVRGIPWGSNVQRVIQTYSSTDVRIIEKDSTVVIEPKSGTVINEVYHFQKGKLFLVKMTYNLAPAAVLDFFTTQYGFRPDFEKEAFYWKFPSTLAKIEKGSNSIWYRSRDIIEETKKEVEQPDDQNDIINRVKIGMSDKQVISLMGNPLSKRIGKSLATVIFLYQTGEIVFKNEKVSEVNPSQVLPPDEPIRKKHIK